MYECPRAFEYHPCRARTCPHCKLAVDVRDYERIRQSAAHSLMYFETTLGRWGTLRKRAQRRKGLLVKVQLDDSDRIGVLTDMVDFGAPLVSDVQLRELLRRRPADPHIQTTGPGLQTV